MAKKKKKNQDEVDFDKFYKYDFYLSGADIVFAQDKEGKVYIFSYPNLTPVDIPIDPYWGGLSITEAIMYSKNK